MIFHTKYLLFSFFLALVAFSALAEPLKILHIGNSFSEDSTHYLSRLARAGGKDVVIYGATKGGCSLECHVKFMDLALKGKLEGKIYRVTRSLTNYEGTDKEVSLLDVFKAEKWDVVTIQQASKFSFDKKSYEPYGEKLLNQINVSIPTAKILLHKTWAYHDEHLIFSTPKKPPVNHFEMHQLLTEAYEAFSRNYGLDIIPSADAVSLAYKNSLPDWHKTVLKNYQYSNQAFGEIVNKKYASSIYNKDGFHLGIAGKYLTACVWYEILFNESVIDNKFFPKELTNEQAKELRHLANFVVGSYRYSKNSVKLQ